MDMVSDRASEPFWLNAWFTKKKTAATGILTTTNEARDWQKQLYGGKAGHLLRDLLKAEPSVKNREFYTSTICWKYDSTSDKICKCTEKNNCSCISFNFILKLICKLKNNASKVSLMQQLTKVKIFGLTSPLFGIKWMSGPIDWSCFAHVALIKMGSYHHQLFIVLTLSLSVPYNQYSQ